MKIENFTVKYGDKIVFSNFNLEILKGEITCILGHSGVGKTTLINHVLSLAKKDCQKVSIAFQEPRLFSHLTVLENLKLIGYCESEILNVLESLGIKDKVNSYPSKLSGGEKQRVNLARALIQDANLLILDEPFSSLDVKLKISIMDFILTNKVGKTILFVTHDIDEALMLSNRIILLKDGKITLDYRLEKDITNREYGKLTSEREILINAQ